MSDYTINSDLPRYVPSRNRRNINKGQQQNKKSNRFHGSTRGFSAGWKPHQDEEQEHPNNSNENLDLSDKEDEIFARPFLPDNHQQDGRSSSPSDSRSNVRQRVGQRLEDFMDEQDHEEWGGPTSIRKEYTDDANAASIRTGRGAAAGGPGDASRVEADTTIEQWMKITVEPPANVGHRLLRLLGWREGNSSAYVPATADDENYHNNKAHDDDSKVDNAVPEATVVLSKKKLRKIQLQQKRVKIPPPKLDTCGLGYEPYQNAPEFKAYQEKRKLAQQRRAQLNSNVYRVSNVLGGRNFDGTDNKQDDNDPKRHRTTYNKSNDDSLDDELSHEYISHETVEDFVGKRSVGGFALREDEDDAYDEEPMSLTKVTDKVKLDTEEYNKEVYEHSSDEEAHDHVEEFPSKRKNNAGKHMGTANNVVSHNDSDDILGVLSSFADTGPTGSLSVGTTNPTKSVTSDGRPPLAGFLLGGAFTSHSMSKRYRGPDVPLSYQVARHEFGPDENSMVLKALSRAVQLEAIDEKRRQALDEALRMNAFSNAPSKRTQASLSNNIATQETQNNSYERSQAPMAGGAFSALAEAMKNRFTSVVEKGSDNKNVEAGLRIPSKDKGMAKPSNGNGRDDTAPDRSSQNNTTQAEKEIRIHRTVRLFAPHRLLCKRFHVSVPTSSTLASAGTNEPGRVTESSYFHQEILNPATAAAVAQKKQEDNSKPAQPKQPVSNIASIFNQDGTMKEEAVPESMAEAKEDRPDIEVFKSIFEPESEMDESETDDEGDDDKAECINAPDGPNINIKETEAENLENSDTKSSEGEEKREASEMVPYNDNDRHKERKRKRSKSKKRRKKRSRSSSSDDSADLSGDSSRSYHSRDHKRDRDRKESRRKKKRHKHKKKKSKRH